MDITKELQTIEPGITRIQVENIIRKIKKHCLSRIWGRVPGVQGTGRLC